MAKETRDPKDKTGQEAAQQGQGTPQAPVHVTIQAPVEKIPDPIPDFDKTREGGFFYVRRGNHDKAPVVAVDAHGNEIDEKDVKAHLASKGETTEDARDDPPSK